MQRFVALDSWRGLCACAVVVFHLAGNVNWSFRGTPLLGNFHLFVDFFFVLSGFVIAGAYEARLRQGYGLVPFMILRLGRIYPLHIAMLAVLVIFAVARALFPLADFRPGDIFDGDIYSFWAIFTNALLLHGIGFEHHLTWNYPSWSISAEVATYVLFALIWRFAVGYRNALVTALLVLCPLVLALAPLDPFSVLNLVRCVAGFAAGVTAQHLYRRVTERRIALPRGALATLAETAVAIGAIGYVLCANFPDAVAFAPFVFAPVVLVFAFEAGALSKALRLAPFVALGTLSYSIYMVHAVLFAIAWRGVTLFEQATGLRITADIAGSAETLWGTAPWIGDMVMVGALAAVIGVSALTYRLIEAPGREWGRVLARRWEARRARPAPAQASEAPTSG
ncbi:MAG: acyltransferase [Terricaulis sp.]